MWRSVPWIRTLCTCPPTIPGSCMAIRSRPGPIGLTFPEFGGQGPVSISASAIRSRRSSDLVGDGDIGESIGIAGEFFITVNPISRAVPLSSIDALTTAAAATFTALEISEAHLDPVTRTADTPHLATEMATVPAPSAELTAVAPPEVTPRVDKAAMAAVDSTAVVLEAVVFTVAAVTPAVIANPD